jgi:hypothetical protein
VDVPGPTPAAKAPWGEGATLVAERPEALLETVRARGELRVLMDATTTALPNHPAHVDESTVIQHRQFQSSDGPTQRFGAGVLHVGLRASLRVGDLLEYDLRVSGLLPYLDVNAPTPTTWTVQWQGTHVPLGGRTLVLRHARQHDLAPTPPAALETYAFLTTRWEPAAPR